MLRASKTQADANHRAIELASACLLQQHGTGAVSVADLMIAAGLTPGAFDGHLAARAALAAQACARAFDDSTSGRSSASRSNPRAGQILAACGTALSTH